LNCPVFRHYENQISHSWVRSSCRSMDSGWVESKDASVSSVSLVFLVGTPKPLVDLVTLRAVYLDASYVRPFGSPATGLLIF